MPVLADRLSDRHLKRLNSPVPMTDRHNLLAIPVSRAARRRARGVRLLDVALALVCTSACVGEAPPATAPDTTLRLLRAATSTEAVGEPIALAVFAEQLDSRSPEWPLDAFLLAEVYLAREDVERATALYRELIAWGASDPYGDQWGGSGLTVAALWRYVDLVSGLPELNAADAEWLLDLDLSRFGGRRLGGAMFRFGFLDAIPQLEEDLLRKLARLADRVGRSGRAQSLFLDYLDIARSTELTAEDERLYEEIIDAGLASRAGLAARRATRLEALVQLGAAEEVWVSLLDAPDEQDRAAAAANLAGLTSRLDRSAEGMARVADLVDMALANTTDADVAQQALLVRAATFVRPGPRTDPAVFVRDLEELIDRYPSGRRADDALFQLATFYHEEFAKSDRADDADLGRSLEYFARLRSFTGQNAWLNFAHFRPALALFARRGPGDLDIAAALLDSLDQRVPDGPLSRAAAFWRARIHAAAGRQEQAAATFAEIRAVNAHDYYGVRSRMHLQRPEAASGAAWPSAVVSEELRREYERGVVPSRLTGDSPYHDRLRRLSRSGVYAELLEIRRQIARSHGSSPLRALTIQTLDSERLIAPLAVLLALRQDALAARDLSPGSEGELEIQALASYHGDTPLATCMSVATFCRSSVATTDANPNALKVRYPLVFDAPLSSSWEQVGVPVELLYGVMRRESSFDPAAHSNADALGLFQFIPTTFAALDRAWNFLEGSGADSREQFLMTPELNIGLGARWFGEELLPHQNRLLERVGGADTNPLELHTPWFEEDLGVLEQRVLLFLLLEHLGGYPRVEAWLGIWEGWGVEKDIEFMIETSSPGRAWLQGIFTDIAIVHAAGIFGNLR